MDRPLVWGMGVNNWRGVGASGVRLGPLARVSFLVGRNNHGKSTLLRMAQLFGTGSESTEALQGAIRDAQRADHVFGRHVLTEVRADALRSSGYFADADDVRRRARGLFRPAFEDSLFCDWVGLSSDPMARVDLRSIDRNYWSGLIGFLPDVARLAGDALEPGLFSREEDRWGLQVATRQSSVLRDVENLGDGISQILMIGAAALRYDHTLVCVEEPELHLHAGLQRKLIRHLVAGTSNQYLIATHSTAMLDLPGARVFHVTHDGDSIQVSPATSVDDVVRVSEDLGFRVSDLMQTNYTVWVEGPSDRIYWRHWLHLVDPTLIEGVHYLLVSYGGRLVDDLRLDGGGEARGLTEQEVEQRLDILRLGRWCTLIADSDRTAKDVELGPHHARLREESEKSRTATYLVMDHVRTVESLVPAELLQQAVRTVHPSKGRLFSKPADPFANPFEGVDRPDKVSTARSVRELERDPAGLDPELLVVLSALSDRIRSANGLPARA